MKSACKKEKHVCYFKNNMCVTNTSSPTTYPTTPTIPMDVCEKIQSIDKKKRKRCMNEKKCIWDGAKCKPSLNN